MQFDEDAVQYLLVTEAQHFSMARTILPRLAEAAALGHAALTTASPFSPVPYCTLIILTKAAWTC
jgi:hypothetical protein